MGADSNYRAGDIDVALACCGVCSGGCGKLGGGEGKSEDNGIGEKRIAINGKLLIGGEINGGNNGTISRYITRRVG